jgi:hypothetical protein
MTRVRASKPLIPNATPDQRQAHSSPNHHPQHIGAPCFVIKRSATNLFHIFVLTAAKTKKARPKA